MKNHLSILSILIFLLFVPIASSQETEEQLDQQITNLVSLIRDADAVEYKCDRIIQKFIFGNMSVAVVVLTVGNFGGGNNYCQYMAVFIDAHENETAKNKYFSMLDYALVGGKAWRVVYNVAAKLEKKQQILRIALQTMANSENDGVNTFKIPGEAVYSVNIQAGTGTHLRQIAYKIKKNTASKPIKHDE